MVKCQYALQAFELNKGVILLCIVSFSIVYIYICMNGDIPPQVMFGD